MPALTMAFFEKPQSGLFVTVNGQQEVDRLTIRIHRMVQITPLAFDLDKGFVHPPTVANRFLESLAESAFKFRREFLQPAVNR